MKIKEYIKNKKLYVLAIALVLIATITATSYAYFSATVTGTGNTTVVTSGSMEMEFTDGPAVSLQNAIPGTYIEKTFSVKNVGTAPTSYDVYMSELINEFEDKTDLVYTLTSNDGGANKEETIVPSTPDKIVTNQSIEVGATHNYVLRISFLETNDNQDDNKGKLFSTIIRVNEVDVAKKQITLNVNNETITITKGVGISLGDITTPNVEGYDFDGLYLDSGYENRVDENTIVTTTMNELYAKYIPKTDTGYKVEHYQMDTNGNYSATPYETENLTGTTDTSVTPGVKTYEHFNSPVTQTVNINADGSQVVKYYYERQKYTITFDANGGSVSPTSVTDYYGKSITLPTPSYTKYHFDGWYTLSEDGDEVDNTTRWTSSQTIFAHWTKYNYTGSLASAKACLKDNFGHSLCLPANYYASNGNSVASVTNKLKASLESNFGFPATCTSYPSDQFLRCTINDCFGFSVDPSSVQVSAGSTSCSVSTDGLSSPCIDIVGSSCSRW